MKGTDLAALRRYAIESVFELVEDANSDPQQGNEILFVRNVRCARRLPEEGQLSGKRKFAYNTRHCQGAV